MGIDEVFTIEEIFSRCGIAAEAYAGSAGLTHIAEYHSHNTNRGTPLIGYAFHLAIENSALIHPTAEYGTYRAPELLHGIVGEVMTCLVLNSGLEFSNKQFELVNIEVLIKLDATDTFNLLNNGFEGVYILFIDGFHAKNHIAVHLYEAAIAVIDEVGVVGLLDHTFRHDVIQSEVEDGIHHARHRGSGS